MIGNVKLLAASGALVALLAGLAYGQYHRASSLKEQRDGLREEVAGAVAHVEELVALREAEQELIARRNRERKLLYAEVNSLKKNLSRLEDQASINWRNTYVPDPVRRLYLDGETADHPNRTPGGTSGPDD